MAARTPEPRGLTEADLSRVVEIERHTFSDPWSRNAFLETMARDEVRGFALEDDRGLLVGYGLCVIAADEGEILNLAVDPGCRRSGLGRQLVGTMLDWLRKAGAGRVYLEVRQSNLPAIGLYRSLGFETMGSRRGYYTHPREDAVTMGLDVTQNTARKW